MNKNSKNIFIKNFTNLSLNQGVNILLAIVITPILYQNLGQADFGLVSLYFSVITILNIIVSYGFHLNGPKRVAIVKSNYNKVQSLVSDIVSLRIIIALVLLILIFIFGYHFEWTYEHKSIFLFSLICLFREALIPDFFLQGIDNLFYAALNNFFSKCIYFLLVILFVKSPEESYLVNFYFGVSSVFVYLIFWIFLFIRKKINVLKFSLQNIYKNLIKNFKFFLSSVAGHLSIHSSLIILSNFINEVELGQFALAHRVVFLLRLVPTFFVQSILQRVSILNNKKLIIKNFIQKYYLMGLLLTLIMAIIVILFSKYIIYILSGEIVDLSIKLLYILCLIPFLAMLNFKNIIFILVNELQDVLFKASYVSSLFTIIFLIIGSLCYGSIGISISLLFSEIITFVTFSIFLKKYEKE